MRKIEIGEKVYIVLDYSILRNIEFTEFLVVNTNSRNDYIQLEEMETGDMYYVEKGNLYYETGHRELITSFTLIVTSTSILLESKYRHMMSVLHNQYSAIEKEQRAVLLMFDKMKWYKKWVLLIPLLKTRRRIMKMKRKAWEELDIIWF